MIHMDEAESGVVAIVAAILVARHLKNPEDLHESRPSPRTESLIASAVQWAACAAGNNAAPHNCGLLCL